MTVSSIFSGTSSVLGWSVRAALPTSDAAQLAATCAPFKNNFLFLNLERSDSCVTDETRARYARLLEKLPFRKKPELIAGPFKEVAGAIGNSFFPFSPQIIVIDSVGEAIDPDAMWMFIKHEISHLHNNDILRKKTVQLVSNIALAYFFPVFPLSAVMVYFGQAGLTSFIEKHMGKNAEASADAFACQDASENELQGFLRALEACRRAENAHFQLLAQNPTSLVAANEIGARLIDPHPMIEARIQHVEQCLKRLNPEIDLQKVKNDPRVTALETWWTYLQNNQYGSNGEINRAALNEAIDKCNEILKTRVVN